VCYELVFVATKRVASQKVQISHHQSTQILPPSDTMKLRVRTIDGGTLKVEAEKTDSVHSFIAKLELSAELAMSRAELCLSLNKKDFLSLGSTLEANGIRGGDLVHLVPRSGGAPATIPPSPQSPAALVAGTNTAHNSFGSTTHPAPPPQASLFGLPTAAPTADVASNVGGGAVSRISITDSVGRVWEQTVTSSSIPSARSSTDAGGIATARRAQTCLTPEEGLAMERSSCYSVYYVSS
jgi:hypothetical protein